MSRSPRAAAPPPPHPHTHTAHIPSLPLATLQPPVLARPQRRGTLAPPPPYWLLQVGADRLRSAPRSALRSNPGYTQRRHPPSRHWALSTLGYPKAIGRPPREAAFWKP